MAWTYQESPFSNAAAGGTVGNQYEEQTFAGCAVGDLLVVIGAAENQSGTDTRAVTTQAGSTGAWTLSKPGFSGGSSTDCPVVGGYAFVTAAGSVTVRTTLNTFSASNLMGGGFFRIPAAEVGANPGWLTPLSADADGQISLTLSTNSQLIMLLADWNAVPTATTTGVPSTGITYHQRYRLNVSYSVWLASWTNQAAGTRNYGTSGVSGGKISGVIFRMDTPGSSVPDGAANVLHTWTVAASGKAIKRGLSNLLHAWTVNARGATTKQGSSTLSHLWQVAARGESDPKGSAALTHSWAVTASGDAPGVGPAHGSASVLHVWTVNARGKVEPKGSAAVVDQWTVTAQGFKPAEDASLGTGAVAHTWNVAARGSSQRSGSLSVLHRWNVTARGSRDSRGGASLEHRWALTAQGATPVLMPTVGRSSLTHRWEVAARGLVSRQGSASLLHDWSVAARGLQPGAMPPPDDLHVRPAGRVSFTGQQIGLRGQRVGLEEQCRT